MKFFATHKVLTVILLISGVFILIIGSLLLWPYIYYEKSRAMYIPKIINLRIEERSVHQWNNSIVEVMQRTKALIFCDIVPDKKGYSFKFIIGNKVFPRKDCIYEYFISEPVGMNIPLEIHYLGNNGNIIGKRKSNLTVIPKGERFFIYNLEDENGKIQTTHTVPINLKAYGYAYLSSKIKADNLKVLYFVQEYPEGAPILQVVVKKEEDSKEVKITPNISHLLKFRRFGDEINGYTFWTKDFLQIGNVYDERKVFTIYAVLAQKKDIEEILKKTLSYEGISEEEKVLIKTNFLSIEQIKKNIAFQEYISEGFNIVRAPGGSKNVTVEIIYR